MSLLTFSRLRRRRAANGSPETSHIPAQEPSRRRHKGLEIVIIVVAVLVVIGLLASPIATSVVNRKLNGLEGITGHAGQVQVALWRGAVDIEDLVIKSRDKQQELPLVKIRKASMRVAPGALFSGKLGGAMTVDGAEFNVVKLERVEDPTKAAENAASELKEKKEAVVRWQDTLRKAFPMELTKLEVKNAQFRFVDRSHQPNAEFALNNLHLVATDLQNRPKANGDPLPAKLRIDGTTTGNGQFHANVQIDPIAQQPRFTANFELKGMQLPPANPFLLAYANADVSRGSFEVYMEVEAKDGAYDGYVKPLFHDLDFRTASDKDKNLAEKVKEKVVGLVASVLKNDDEEQVATRAPFAGNFADNDVDIWSTIATLFRNAFVQALRGGFEGRTPGA